MTQCIFAGRMIHATDIHKSFGTLEVLKGASLEVKQGEIVAITGKSGAGKSTLLHILGTLEAPTKGTLEIRGERVFALPARKLAAFRNHHIGFVFQFHHLLPEFTALENICIPALIDRRPESQVKKQALEWLDYLGLSARQSHKPGALSGGEQQRVAVARALINQPAVILADEPSGNLDTASSHELHRLFFQLRKEFGQTFVIVTHNLELAAMSDRSLEMKDGML